MKQRIITALLLLPLAVFFVYSPKLELFSQILAGVFVIMAWEWSRLLETSSVVIKTAYIVIQTVLIAGLYYLLVDANYFANPSIPLNWTDVYPYKLLLVGLLCWVLALVWVVLYPKASGLWTKGPWLRCLLGFVMLPVAWLSVIFIRSSGYQYDPHHGANLLILMFIIIWAADSGAYFAGKALGKHKLSPVVSPNKTWEGVIGGLIVSVILSSIIGYYLGLPLELKLFIPLVAGLVFISILGDLFESMLKRQAKIKDSSNILPGHGGLLDRLDSTISVAPFFVVILLWLNGSL